MQTVTKTYGELIDEAIERLPFVRRRAAKLRMRSRRYREQVEAELAIKLHDDQECCAMGLQPVFAGNATAATPIQIDVDKLEQLLAIIVKYLPLILEIILPLFAPAIAFLAACLLPSAAMAQGCHGDQCPTETPPGQAVQVTTQPSVAVVPVQPVIYAQPVVSTPVVAAPAPVVATTPYRAPVRSAVAVVAQRPVVQVAAAPVVRTARAGRRFAGGVIYRGRNLIAAMRPRNILGRLRTRNGR